MQRNEPCPCGSGQKYKDCHFAEGEVFLRKLERRRFKQQQKTDGTPWYVRWLT
ncbi:MAG: SEC-C metal-binding domain-containing protein [Acidobacteria bacterium]|nr:SEC-C metal-binding domain-containing protein [Acidobacteriota bacterium]